MKLANNITIPAILYFLLFLSLAIPKKQYPLLAKVKAVNKSMKFPPSYIFFKTALSSDIGIPKYAMKS